MRRSRMMGEGLGDGRFAALSAAPTTPAQSMRAASGQPLAVGMGTTMGTASAVAARVEAPGPAVAAHAAVAATAAVDSRRFELRQRRGSAIGGSTDAVRRESH